MLRETARQDAQRRPGNSERRAGTIVSLNDNGTYQVTIDGQTYTQVPSAGLQFYRPDQRVVVMFEDGLPRIVP